jgi:hypothetical protein
MNATPSSAFLVSLPKSGTEFVANSLMDTYGLDRPSIGAGAFPNINLDYNELSRFGGGGLVAAGHFAPNSYNTFVLSEFVPSVAIILRDPRDAVISFARMFGSEHLLDGFHSQLYGFSTIASSSQFDQLRFAIEYWLPQFIAFCNDWISIATVDPVRYRIFHVVGDQGRRTLPDLAEFFRLPEYSVTDWKIDRARAIHKSPYPSSKLLLGAELRGLVDRYPLGAVGDFLRLSAYSGDQSDIAPM